jgi:hypothetical protein
MKRRTDSPTTLAPVSDNTPDPPAAPPSAPCESAATPTLDELVQTVAYQRSAANAVLEQLATARRAFEDACRPLFERREAALAALDTAETALRDATLAAFAATGAKRPHPATGIRVTTRLEYDVDAMTEYARRHLPQVLKLDKKLFEDVAPTLRLPGVTVIEEPAATIAQDLRRYLAFPTGAEPPTSANADSASPAQAAA